MTFLQPWLLWALPLALLPVLIHLFNRLRHRSMPWAAMMFLRSATRKSTRYARLRQFLILMFRVLAVLTLIVALGRPLAGGWAGWMFSGAPDVILLLLDRSASMEVVEGEVSKRGEAVRLMSQAAAKYQEASRVIFVDSATLTPQELENASVLTELPAAAATDTAADVPGMLQSALDWMVQTKPGSAEIWIASDLQESNWDSNSDRWSGLASGFAALPQRVRTRLLALNSEPAANHSVKVIEAVRRQTGARAELELVLDIERSSASPVTLPLTVNLDGVATQVELRMDGPTLRYRYKATLGGANSQGPSSGGWGFVALPSDANERDNRSYFVYSGATTLRSAVVASEPLTARLLQLATAPDPRNTNQVCEILGANATESTNFEKYAMVLWQGPLPKDAAGARLRSFVEAGGVVVFFPPGSTEATPSDAAGGVKPPGSEFAEYTWSDVQNAPADKPFRVTSWDERDGPFAKTEEGLSLPLADLAIIRRQTITNPGTSLATFEDGTPFLTRHTLGRGQIFFCATQPTREWSNLEEGVVLVPMLQRLVEAAARRFAAPAFVECGEWEPDENDRWTAIDSSASKNVLIESGVYRSGPKMIAVNRPVREDVPDLVDTTRAKGLLGSVPIYMFDERQSGAARVQAELWRLFLVLMALCLVVEGILILPEKMGREPRIESQTDTVAAGVNPRTEKRDEVVA
jgi:hypothetical protein